MEIFYLSFESFINYDGLSIIIGANTAKTFGSGSARTFLL